MTLVEMLVAMTATLILMAAVAQVFGAFGAAMTGSRAAIGTDARLRTVAARLRDDLAGVTVQMLPPRDPGQGEGYFEIIEGPGRDGDAANGTDTLTADIDDALLFTTRANGDPFIGRGPAGTRFESTVAEVAWFARPTTPATTPVTYTLYRKQLLVMGYAGVSPFVSGTAAWNSWANYFNTCDVSARKEKVTVFPNTEKVTVFPNTLGDLTRREARFYHNPTGATDGSAFPFPFVDHQAASVDAGAETLPSQIEGLVFDSTSLRQSEDVILTNVLAFDVRVFDPTVSVIQPSGGTALIPGDPNYAAAEGSATGAYVDIGHNAGGVFSANSAIQVGGLGDKLTRTYCTWSTHYEANGLDDDEDGVVDQGTDGLDNAVTNSLVDEGDEQETSPPYPYPLRGIEVRIRCYEPSSRQVRQVTVRQTFVPH